IEGPACRRTTAWTRACPTTPPPASAPTPVVLRFVKPCKPISQHADAIILLPACFNVGEECLPWGKCEPVPFPSGAPVFIGLDLRRHPQQPAADQRASRLHEEPAGRRVLAGLGAGPVHLRPCRPSVRQRLIQEISARPADAVLCTKPKLKNGG